MLMKRTSQWSYACRKVSCFGFGINEFHGPAWSGGVAEKVDNSFISIRSEPVSVTGLCQQFDIESPKGVLVFVEEVVVCS